MGGGARYSVALMGGAIMKLLLIIWRIYPLCSPLLAGCAALAAVPADQFQQLLTEPLPPSAAPIAAPVAAPVALPPAPASGGVTVVQPNPINEVGGACETYILIGERIYNGPDGYGACFVEDPAGRHWLINQRGHRFLWGVNHDPSIDYVVGAAESPVGRVWVKPGSRQTAGEVEAPALCRARPLKWGRCYSVADPHSDPYRTATLGGVTLCQPARINVTPNAPGIRVDATALGNLWAGGRCSAPTLSLLGAWVLWWAAPLGIIHGRCRWWWAGSCTNSPSMLRFSLDEWRESGTGDA